MLLPVNDGNRELYYSCLFILFSQTQTQISLPQSRLLYLTTLLTLLFEWLFYYLNINKSIADILTITPKPAPSTVPTSVY